MLCEALLAVRDTKGGKWRSTELSKLTGMLDTAERLALLKDSRIEHGFSVQHIAEQLGVWSHEDYAAATYPELQQPLSQLARVRAINASMR
jgi:hypothetical protein